MVKKPKKEDALAELLAVASASALTDLILQLAANRPDVRRECFDFLKRHVSVSKALDERAEGEIVAALWAELEPDLSEMDDHGGGDYATEDHDGAAARLQYVSVQYRTHYDSPHSLQFDSSTAE